MLNRIEENAIVESNLTGDTVIGMLMGGVIGYAVTRIEQQVGPKGHSYIGTLAGITIGGLAFRLTAKEAI
jgi:hypothetical protein